MKRSILKKPISNERIFLPLFAYEPSIFSWYIFFFFFFFVRRRENHREVQR